MWCDAMIIITLAVVVLIRWTQVVDLYVQSIMQNKFRNTVTIKKYFKNLLTQLYYDFR